jgi:hypothetical protein
MDTLNDYYPMYPYLPDSDEYSSDQEQDVKNIIDTLTSGNKKRLPLIDEWNIYHSDNLWYLWCIVNEYISNNNLPFLDKIDYPKFCEIIYTNSSKS